MLYQCVASVVGEHPVVIGSRRASGNGIESLACRSFRQVVGVTVDGQQPSLPHRIDVT